MRLALQHEFVFVSKEKGELTSSGSFWMERLFQYKNEASVRECAILSDDIIVYIMGFLSWIPTYNPEPRRSEKEFGLHYTGITKIEKDGADVAIQLFRFLIAMFSLAPETIKLTGSFRWTEGEDDGEYEVLSFDRDLLCSQLETLVTLFKKVQKEEGYLLHFGV